MPFKLPDTRQKPRPIKLLSIHNHIWEYTIGRNSISFVDPEETVYHVKLADIVDQEADLTDDILIKYVQTQILEPKWAREGMPTCGRCDEKKPDVILQVNPYASEIQDDDTKVYLCRDCASDLAENI